MNAPSHISTAPTPPTLADYVTAQRELFDHFRGLCRTLTEEQLAVQSLCPAWSVRDVIAHVIGVEAVLDGWQPALDAPLPFDRLADFQRDAAALDRDAFADFIDATVASRLADLAQMDDAIVDAPSITPSGPATYGRFMQIRLFDLWVHARDVAVPLGHTPPFGSGFAAERSIDEVEAAMGYIVGKKIGMTEGQSILFRLTGGVDRSIAVAVTGRATVVDELDAPTVVLTLDSETFILLAAGRVDPDLPIGAGLVTWTGDSEWGERAARTLAYTR